MSQRVLGRQLDSGDAKMNRLVTEAIPHPLGLRMMASRPTSSGHHHIRYFPLPQVEGRVSAVKRTCDESYCSPYYEPAHWGLEIVGVVE